MFTMRFKRGDIVLVLFPNSDGVTFKKHPALIVQADNLSTGLAQTVVALVTSNMARQVSQPPARCRHFCRGASDRSAH